MNVTENYLKSGRRSGVNSEGEVIVLGELMLAQTKTCAKCREVKSIEQFYRSKKARDGRGSYCKDCQREITTVYRNEHRERVRGQWLRSYYNRKNQKMEYQRNYRKNNPKKVYVHELRKHHPERQPIANACLFCGSQENLVRHHPDYNIPALYVTCCRQCHWWIHNS